jgi:Icc-related predicted phosphoesterase
MKIQYFSDIHLEFGDCDFPETDADIIIAAGDIGVDIEAVEWLAQAPSPVIYIAGNHEYYSGDLSLTRKRLEQAAAEARIDFLENMRVDLDDVRFLGTTLWTDFNGADPDIMQEAIRTMNDFNFIDYDGVPLRPEDLVEIHEDSLAWLEVQLDAKHNGKTVVITHHAPTMKSWSGEPENDVRRYAYCNELSTLLRKYPVDLWIHGHIHHVSDYKVGGTRVVCNPRGYHGHQQIEGYDPCRIIEI